MRKMGINDSGMIYIHVPFCASRCIYCDFYSTTLSSAVREEYVEAACRELNNRTSHISTTNIHSIYFGGGTPSLLSVKEIQTLLECIRQNYNVLPQAEVTMECNPDDITPPFVRYIKDLGVNRVSLGVQSFDNDILQLLNRRHNAQEAENAVRTLCQNGINNISIDLIYGLPRQNLRSFKRDLETAFTLPIKHLSAYALSVEKDTPLAHRIDEKKLTIPSEETFAEEYALLMTEAKTHGFEHYEISNFARPGFASLHNSSYWNGTPYLGIGPGAHSFDGDNRRFNLPDIRSYIKQSKKGLFPHETERLKDYERYNELVFTSLRTSKGLSLSKVEQRFGKKAFEYLQNNALPHVKNGRLRTDNGHLTIVPDAIIVSDTIISDLMMADENERMF